MLFGNDDRSGLKKAHSGQKSTSLTGIFVAGSLVALAGALSACSGSSSSSTSPSATTITNAGGAVSAIMTTVLSSAPQVKTSSVVTHNDYRKSKHPKNFFFDVLMPKVYASTSSLSATWGTSGVAPTLSTQVSLPNEFYGGNGSGVSQTNQDTFTVSSANATVGAVYSNNGGSFTVAETISGSTTLVAMVVSGNAGPNGTLTRVSGTGDNTIAFSAVAQDLLFSCDNTAAYCPSPGTYYQTGESLVDYVGQELSSNFKNTNDSSVTIFGRLNSALAIGCTLGHLITDLDTDGLPTVGAHTVNFPSDTSDTVFKSADQGGCGMDSGMAGQSLPVVFSAVSGSANYTKMMTANVGNEITLYMKLDLVNGVFNFMQVENAIGSARYAGDRTMVHMTGMNSAAGSKISFEYLSTGSNCTPGTSTGNSLGNCGTANGDGTGSAVSSSYSSGNWNAGFEFHRGFLDAANDVAYLFSSNGSPGKSDGTVDATHPAVRSIFTAAGKPNEISACTSTSCSQEIAVSFGFVGEHGGTGSVTVGQAADSVNTTDYNGCVSVNTLVVTDDSTLATCGVTGTNASTASATMDTIRAHYSADVLTSLVAGTSGTTPFPFTDGTDIYSAHLDF